MSSARWRLGSTASRFRSAARSSAPSLAVLLLSANEVISVERLIDEVWGDRSPPSAAHSLEAYVSRIRQLLNGHGPTLTRRGAGYRLDLGGATLDADLFAQELQGASDAAAEGDLGLASVLASRALALWHGPALADVSLASAGRAEAERLEEARLRAFELRFDAELDLGHHEAIVGELQVLVGQNPYRERFVAQLMLTLYRSGPSGGGARCLRADTTAARRRPRATAEPRASAALCADRPAGAAAAHAGSNGPQHVARGARPRARRLPGLQCSSGRTRIRDCSDDGTDRERRRAVRPGASRWLTAMRDERAASLSSCRHGDVGMRDLVPWRHASRFARLGASLGTSTRRRSSPA